MLKKIGLLIGAAALGTLVTSCGDDETPTPTPTETGTSTATPTPTPTPTAAVDFSLDTDFSTQSANANAIVAYFTPDGGMSTVFSSAARINGTASIDFVASSETATFGFPDLAAPVSFDAGDLVTYVTTPEEERLYTRGDESLILQLPFAEILRVTYVIGNQPFTRDSVAGTLESRRFSLFFNPVTATDAITAALTYAGSAQVFGGDPGVTPAGALTVTTSNLVITPGATSSDADTVSITINVFRTDGSTSTQVARIAISGEVNDNGVFGGEIDDQTYGLSGRFVGSLAGANREEVLVIFSVTDADADDDDDRRFVGNFIGQR